MSLPCPPHDFVVGPIAAVCNKCTLVQKISDGRSNGNNDHINEVLEDIRSKLAIVEVISTEVLAQRNERLDAYTVSEASMSQKSKSDQKSQLDAKQTQFKESLIKFYNNPRRPTPRGEVLRCMISGEDLFSSEVVAAHLYPKSKAHRLKEFGLSQNDAWSPRMGQLWAKKIEVAFDKKEICLAPHPLESSRLVFTVLEPYLMDSPISIYAKTTFRQLHNKVIMLGDDLQKRPFVRILAFHYQRAMQIHGLQDEMKMYTKSLGWEDRIGMMLKAREKISTSGDDSSNVSSRSPSEDRSHDGEAKCEKHAIANAMSGVKGGSHNLSPAIRIPSKKNQKRHLRRKQKRKAKKQPELTPKLVDCKT